MDRLVDPNVGQLLVEKSKIDDKKVVFNEEMWHGVPLEPEIDEYKVLMREWIYKRI